MKVLIVLFFCALFCGCTAVPEKTEHTPAPAELAMNAARKNAARQKADSYVQAMEKALRSGEFAFLEKELPPEIPRDRAKKIFDAMKKGVAKFGILQKTAYVCSLDCTFYMDYFWKFTFTGTTADTKLPGQKFEALYRVRVIHPKTKPLIASADFFLR